MDFTQKYVEKFNTKDLPYGFWSAESYDAVLLLAKVVRECGENPDRIRDCLNKGKEFDGVAGSFSFNEKGDAERKYSIKTVKNKKVQNLS